MQTIENFQLVYLNENLDEIVEKLRQIVNIVHIFVDIDECLDFITDKFEEIFMVVSEKFSQKLLSIAHDLPQIKSIYIFSQNKSQEIKLNNGCHGIFRDIESICQVLTQTIKDYNHNSISITFSQSSNENNKILDSSFMYTQIFKDILLTINFNDEHRKDFLTYCRTEYAENMTELRKIDRIEKEYHDHEPIWWYTYQSFLYSMLNQALRIMNVNHILKMGFFICDLHNHLTDLHAKQFLQENPPKSFIVYRGQGLSQEDFIQLNNNKGRLLAFNNFLSTTMDRNVSLKFADRAKDNMNLIGILFVIKIDSSIRNTPFANVKNVSCYKKEEEILFSMHSIFRIGQIKQLDTYSRIWEVELIFTSDNDLALHQLTRKIQEETKSHTGWHQMGKLLLQLAEFDVAEELYELLLKQTIDQHERSHILHQLGCIKTEQGNYEKAIEYLKESNSFKRTFSFNSPDLAGSYSGLGFVYYCTGKYSKALEYYEEALKIRQIFYSDNHLEVAADYNNIGTCYYSMEQYAKAFEYFERVLRIYRETLPGNHPSLAISYCHIALIYNHMGKYTESLQYHMKSLEIRQETLPVNHPALADSYNNIGITYYSMKVYSTALEYYEKALEIRRKTVGENHHSLTICYNNIGEIYREIGKYDKALEYYEKTLDIQRKTMPAYHPLLGTYYNNIGMLYYDMKNYIRALEYYEKIFIIQQKIQHPNHSELATTYNNIGAVYYNLNQYSTALGYFEKALHIRQKVLSETNPLIIQSFYNITMLYYNTRQYSKTYAYLQNLLVILQHSLPITHPEIKKVKEYIDIVKKQL